MLRYCAFHQKAWRRATYKVPEGEGCKRCGTQYAEASLESELNIMGGNNFKLKTVF